MRKLMATMLLLCTAVVLVGAQGNEAKLEGTWLLYATGDKKLTKEFFDKAMVKLILHKDGKYEQNVLGEKVESGTYKFDATKSTIDVTIRDGKDEGKKQLGTYKLEGDNLTIVFGKAGSKVRPKNFEPSDDVDLTFFKRLK